MTYYFPSLLPWIVSYFPHDQIFTRYEDGEDFNTCRTSFGAAGNENTACCSRNVKNGMMSVLTAKSVILSLFPTSPALGTSGHLPEWQRSIPVKMGLFAKSSSSQSGKKKLLERPIHKLILIFRPKEDESDAWLSMPTKEHLLPEYDPVGEPELILHIVGLTLIELVFVNICLL